MILEISSGTDTVAVEITSNSSKRKIHLDGTEILCDWIRLAEGHYSLILNGSVFDIVVDVGSETSKAASRAGTYSLRITDPRRTGLKPRAEAGPSGVQRVCADMPGKVVRVLVQQGDAVGYDQSLLVLEAMKMQNEIRAPKAGIVKEVAVAGGTTVNTGDFLVSIES